MGGIPPQTIFGQPLSPNPIIRAKQEQDLIARATRGGLGAPMLKSPFNFAQTGLPTHPQVAPQPAPAALPKPPPPAGSTPQTAPDMRTLLNHDLMQQLTPGTGPQMPTYQAPEQQQDDPKRLLLEGLGMLFARGGAGEAIGQGIAQRQKQYADQYTTDVQQSENAYNRAMTAYDRDVNARENRIAHDVTGIDTIDKNAETAREHRAHDAAVQRGLDIKAQQVADQKSEAHEKLIVSLQETAQRLGVEKSKIAEQYAAFGARNATSLMAAGIHAQTALNVAQLGATARFVQAMWTGQNRKEIAQMQQSGMWDRLQALQQNVNARAAMNSVSKLLAQANNPKDPNAKVAAQALEAAMQNPSSPIAQLMGQFQGMGLMAAPIGDAMQEEIDAETPMPGQGVYPMGGSFIAEPQQPTVVNNYITPGGNGGGGQMPASGDLQGWLSMIFGQHPNGGAGAHVNQNHTQTHGDSVHIPPEAVQSARAWMAHYMGQEGPTKANAEAAFQAMVHAGVVHGSPQEIAALHAQLVGTGAPNLKNSPSPPPLSLPQIP